MSMLCSLTAFSPRSSHLVSKLKDAQLQVSARDRGYIQLLQYIQSVHVFFSLGCHGDCRVLSVTDTPGDVSGLKTL